MNLFTADWVGDFHGSADIQQIKKKKNSLHIRFVFAVTEFLNIDINKFIFKVDSEFIEEEIIPEVSFRSY